MNIRLVIIGILLLLLTGCGCQEPQFEAAGRIDRLPPGVSRAVKGAVEQLNYTYYYIDSYEKLKYPNGDVDRSKGVCTDVVVRAFRRAGVDLQKEVFEDMSRDFSSYPQLWGHEKPDANIDHRRVPNLMTFFQRQQKALPITRNGNDYLPGDVVVWKFSKGLHTGIVVDRVNCQGTNFYVVHNAGKGARMEDKLFRWPIIGHYRYFN
jgi:uncharacterized protein